MNPTYHYAISNIRVIDGDTLEVDVDLGFRIWSRKVYLRLIKINCPETNTPEGKEAKSYVQGLFDTTPTGWTAQIFKPDKYGNRWNAEVLFPNGLSLNYHLLEMGHAKPYLLGETP